MFAYWDLSITSRFPNCQKPIFHYHIAERIKKLEFRIRGNTSMTKTLLGVSIDSINATNFIATLEAKLKEKPQLQIVTPNPEHLIQAQDNPEFKKVLNEADISIPDGIGIVWGFRIQSIKYLVFSILGKKSQINDDYRMSNVEENPSGHDQSHLSTLSSPGSSLNTKYEIPNTRFTGIDALFQLCDYAQTQNWKVALLGGIGNTAELAAQQLSHQYPNLTIASFPGDPNIKQPDSTLNTQIIGQLNQFQPSLLVVAYGAPFQEFWIAQNKHNLPSVKVCIGVGGALDVISGRLKRAPVWMQSAGLEWLYRLIQEPWRWKRQLRLFQFIWLILTKP